MDIEKLLERFEDGQREYASATTQVRQATDDAIRELREAARMSKVHERYARMYAKRLQRDIAKLGNVDE